MKYFISDCHIGDGGATDEFKAKSHFLVELLDRIVDEKVGDEVQELILLGDIVDFIEVPLSSHLPEDASYNDQALCQLEDGVFPGHPDIFDHISRFISKGNSIFYVWGNHDYPLRFGNVNEALAQRILKKTRDRTDYGKFTVGDYYLSHRMNLYAEHGHTFDPLNLHTDGQEPFGSVLARDFIHKWENRCYQGTVRDVFGDRMAEAIAEDLKDACHIDRVRPFQILRTVRPRGNIINFIKRLVKMGVLPINVREEMLADLSKVLIKTGRETQSRVLEWLSQPGLRALRSVVVKYRMSDDTPQLLRTGAEKILDEIQNAKDLDFIPNICIMGHSHFVDARDMTDKTFIPVADDLPLEPDKKYYFNIASWMDHALVDREGRVGKHYRACPYLKLKRDERGNLRVSLLNAAEPGHPPIDMEKYRERYIEYGTAFE